MLQNPVGQLHQFHIFGRLRIAAGQQRSDNFTQMIVRRDKADPGGITAVFHRQWTLCRNRRHFHSGRTQRFGKDRICVQGFDEAQGLLTGDGIRAVGEDTPLLQRPVSRLKADQIAAIADIPLVERNPQCRRFHGRAAGEIPQRITSKNGEDPRFAACRKLWGTIAHAADYAPGGQRVDGRDRRGFQRRFTAQLRYGVIGHSISDHQQMLHICSYSRRCNRRKIHYNSPQSQ